MRYHIHTFVISKHVAVEVLKHCRNSNEVLVCSLTAETVEFK
jgi:hypothetical protein